MLLFKTSNLICQSDSLPKLPNIFPIIFSAYTVCLTTNNGSNIVKAARDLSWRRLSCFGHNLHLAVTKSLNGDQRCIRVLGVCHKIVSAFSQSWNRKQELIKAQINLGINQKSLVADCPTMWGKMGKMVSEQKKAIRLALSVDRSASHLIPTWQDIDVLGSINKALSPLHELTDILCLENSMLQYQL